MVKSTISLTPTLDLELENSLSGDASRSSHTSDAGSFNTSHLPTLQDSSNSLFSSSSCPLVQDVVQDESNVDGTEPSSSQKSHESAPPSTPQRRKPIRFVTIKELEVLDELELNFDEYECGMINVICKRKTETVDDIIPNSSDSVSVLDKTHESKSRLQNKEAKNVCEQKNMQNFTLSKIKDPSTRTPISSIDPNVPVNLQQKRKIKRNLEEDFEKNNDCSVKKFKLNSNSDESNNIIDENIQSISDEDVKIIAVISPKQRSENLSKICHANLFEKSSFGIFKKAEVAEAFNKVIDKDKDPKILSPTTNTNVYLEELKDSTSNSSYGSDNLQIKKSMTVLDTDQDKQSKPSINSSLNGITSKIKKLLSSKKKPKLIDGQGSLLSFFKKSPFKGKWYLSAFNFTNYSVIL